MTNWFSIKKRAACARSAGVPIRPTGKRADIAVKAACLSSEIRSHTGVSTHPGESTLTRTGPSSTVADECPHQVTAS